MKIKTLFWFGICLMLILSITLASSCSTPPLKTWSISGPTATTAPAFTSKPAVTSTPAPSTAPTLTVKPTATTSPTVTALPTSPVTPAPSQTPPPTTTATPAPTQTPAPTTAPKPAATLAAVPLGKASNFAVLAKTGISTTGVTSIAGDIGLGPISSSYITGFGLVKDASNQYSTSSMVAGKVYASDYTVPTGAYVTTSINDMHTAYTNAVERRTPNASEFGAGNIGGMTLAPGLYKWGNDVTIATDLTLSGGPDDVWIFQIAHTLTAADNVKINLTGGAQAKNIFWQVAAKTTLGTSSVFNGIILCQTTIILNSGATLNGRALAQTSVQLGDKTTIKPAP
jgi:hypothetical protein